MSDEKRTIGGNFGELPLYLRLALAKYAWEHIHQTDLSSEVFLEPLTLTVECEVRPHAQESHPDDDATGHNGGGENVMMRPSWGQVGC